MSCPYFCPKEKSEVRTWAIMPLGDSYRGMCRADPERAFHPEDAAVREFCNNGYARNACSWFPSRPGPDAVRFCISRDSGTMIDMFWVMEQNHEPFAQGPLEYSPVMDQFTAPPASDLLEIQARAYLESYLRRRR